LREEAGRKRRKKSTEREREREIRKIINSTII
jgi:hypothetical protein